MDLLRLSVKTISSVLAGLFWGGFGFAGFCGGVGVADFCLGAVTFCLSVGFAVGAVIVFVVDVLSAAGTMTVLESTTGNVLFSGIVASKRQGKVKRPFNVVVGSFDQVEKSSNGVLTSIHPAQAQSGWSVRPLLARRLGRSIRRHRYH